MVVALYPGSFDPPTLGHCDVITRASRIFDHLIIAIGVHHQKISLFTIEERIAMLEEITQEAAKKSGHSIGIMHFQGLAIDTARAMGAKVMIRGMRDSNDFVQEIQMAGMNEMMAPDIDTIYFVARPAVRHIASSLVRQVAELGGPVTAFVPPHVAAKLEKLKKA